MKNNIAFGSTVIRLVAVAGVRTRRTEAGMYTLITTFGAAATNFIQWGRERLQHLRCMGGRNWQLRHNGMLPFGAGCPQFVNASAAQFWLRPTSPAINAGINLGSPYNIGLLPGSSWPNSVLLEIRIPTELDGKLAPTYLRARPFSEF